MKKVWLFLIGLMFAADLSATTYYVRLDGGTAAQCDGTVNVAVSADHHCAWISGHIAFPAPTYNGTPTPLIPSGSTLHFGDGEFPIGFIPGAQTPGTGNCNSGLDSCGLYIKGDHYTLIGNGSDKTQLYGTGGVWSMLVLAGNYLTLSHMTITDHSACGLNGDANACGPIGTSKPWAKNGIFANHIACLTMDDVTVRGLANAGMDVGGLSSINGCKSLDATNVRVIGNAFSGWNGDVCNGDRTCPNSGTISWTGGEVAWNGSIEAYPPGTGADPIIIASYGQGQINGYGDGVGMGETGGDWRVTGVKIHHNTQDGWDLLYLKDAGSVIFDQVYAYANAGNQLKGMGQVTIQNSVIVASCVYWSLNPPNYLQGQNIPVPPASTTGRYGLEGDDVCRASGDAVALAAHHLPMVIKNTTISMSSGGAISVTEETPGDSSNSTLLIQDTLISGNKNIQFAEYASTHNGTVNAPVVYDYFNITGVGPVVTWNHDLVYGVKNNDCPVGTSILCLDPKVTNPLVTSFDGTPLAGSPLIGAGTGGINIGATLGGTTPPQQCTNPPPTSTPTCPDGSHQTGGTWTQAAYPGCGWGYIGGTCPVPVITFSVTVSQISPSGTVRHTFSPVLPNEVVAIAPILTPTLHWIASHGGDIFTFPKATQVTVTQVQNGKTAPAAPVKH